MSKAFTKESDRDDEDDPEEIDVMPAGQKNYMTPSGLASLKAEWRALFHEERPKIVTIVSWAAGSGDRSENGDYIYGKKRLREIDRRVRYLLKRIESAEVVDPARQQHLEQVFFGATVSYARADGAEQTVRIVGIDEAGQSDAQEGRISFLSPVARALMKSRVGDLVELRTPSGTETIEILSVHYETGE